MIWNGCDVLVFWVLFVVLILETCFGTDGCYQMNSGNKICFMSDGSRTTFEGSKEFCQKNGGFLLEIYDNEMQRLVEEYGRNNPPSFGAAWLNLVRTNSNVWVWGGEESGNYLTYSNWETSNPSPNGVNGAFMDMQYKWKNSYDPQLASTLCIQGNRDSYFPNSGSTSKAVGIGVGVGLGGLVLIVASSLLIAKFVFHKEIPLPFKSSRSTKPPPHQTASDVTRVDLVDGGYEQIDESKIGIIQNSSGPGTTYAEVVTVQDPHQPPSHDYYNDNDNSNNYNNNNNNNNNNSNNSNNKVLDYVDIDRSIPSNSIQEPERIASPNGALYTKTFEMKQIDCLTTD